MALIVDLNAEHNNTGVDIRDVYIRITSGLFYPKHNVFKIIVYGFINKESGQLHRIREEAEQQEFSDAIAITNLGYIPGDAVMTLGPDFSGALEVLRNFKDPMTIFSEMYNIAIPSDVEITVESLWTFAYQIIKKDSRFKNIRDEV